MFKLKELPWCGNGYGWNFELTAQIKFPVVMTVTYLGFAEQR